MFDAAHVLPGAIDSLPLPVPTHSTEDAFAGRVMDLMAGRYGFSPRTAALPQVRAAIAARQAGRSREGYWRQLVASASCEDELQQLVEDLLNHETECGRTPPHFEALRTQVLPPLAATERPLRLASLGCSTGEEAYTLALAVCETFGSARRVDVEVVGLDVSRRALAIARAGAYPEGSLRELTAAQRERGFTRGPAGYQVRPEIARFVRFCHHNLMAPLPLASIDVIFCRNVLIYFSPASANLVLGHIRDALSRGGLLFLGHTESALHQRGWFSPVSFTDTLAYRRR